MPIRRGTLLCCCALALLLVVSTRAMVLSCLTRSSNCCSRRATLNRGCVLHYQREPEATSNTTGDVLYGDDPRLSKARVEEMEAWLDAAGVDRRGGTNGAPTARLRCFAGRGIGLEAAVDLERDSTVASIPRRVCLSSDAADAPTGTLRAWAHALLASFPAPAPTGLQECSGEAITFERDVAVVTLQVFVEVVAGARSAYAPWMAMLDGKWTQTLPALWPLCDLSALKGTLVLREVRKCLERSKVERNVVAAAIESGLKQGVGTARGGSGTGALPEEHGLGYEEMKGRPTQAEWLRARCAVQSRAYRVGPRYLLIPLVDFANHNDDVAFAVCPGDGVFTCSNEVVFAADRSYLRGQEVCTTYGDMDNAKRLFSFGFVTLTRPAKRSSCLADELSLPTEAFCDVSVDFDISDPLRSIKESVLQEHRRQADGGVATLGAVFPLSRSHPFVSQLVEGPARSFVESAMPLLRLIALTPNELTGAALGDLFECRQGSPIVAGNSCKGWVVEQGSVCCDSAQVYDYGDAEKKEACHPPDVFPVRLEGGGIQVLARLSRRISVDNEREALCLLAQQCATRLEAIGLALRDLEALKEAAFDGNESTTFVATEPRRLLCATVRVGEAIAWHALLEACTSVVRGPNVRERSNERTWAFWVSERCTRLE